MNYEKVKDGYETLDSAICMLDGLLRKYPLVLKIDLAKKARLELEKASRLLKDGIFEDIEINSDRDDDKGNSFVSGQDIDNSGQDAEISTENSPESGPNVQATDESGNSVSE